MHRRIRLSYWRNWKLYETGFENFKVEARSSVAMIHTKNVVERFTDTMSWLMKLNDNLSLKITSFAWVFFTTNLMLGWFLSISSFLPQCVGYQPLKFSFENLSFLFSYKSVFWDILSQPTVLLDLQYSTKNFDLYRKWQTWCGLSNNFFISLAVQDFVSPNVNA